MNLIKILIIVTNINMYASGNYPTGLWLSELTHIYQAAKDKGYDVTIASPNGGNIPVDPESLKFLHWIKFQKYWTDNSFRELLNNSKSLKEVENDNYDVVYLAGGHGTMYDFPDDKTLQKLLLNNMKVENWWRPFVME